MRRITTTFDKLGGQVLMIGYQGESGATEVVIDCAAALEEYGGTTPLLYVTGPDATVRLAQITVENGVVKWIVGAADTKRYGKGEIQLEILDGNSTLVASAEAVTVVIRSNAEDGNLCPEEAVTPEKYGAKGDGETDDTDAIQAALDSGKKVVLTGEYLISKALKYSSNTVMDGHHRGQVRLAPGLTQRVKAMLVPKTNQVHDVLIVGLLFDQRGDGDLYDFNGDSFCVSVSGTKNVTIEECTFKNIITMAVWSGETTYSTDNLMIRHCVVTNSAAGGFSVFANLENTQIIENYLTGCKDDPIALQALRNSGFIPKKSIIRGNIICDNATLGGDGSTPHAILCLGCTGIIIDGNYIDGTYATAIQITSGARTVTEYALDADITNNVIKNAGKNNTDNLMPGNGITVAGGETENEDDIYVTNAVISGNIIDKTWKVGVSLTKARHMFVYGNSVSNTDSPGIALTDCADVTASNNKLYKCGVRINKSAIWLDGGSDLDIFGNYCSGSGCDYGITIRSGTDKVNVRMNTFLDCAEDGTISNAGTNVSLLGNIWKGNKPHKKAVTLTAGETSTAIAINGNAAGAGIVVVTPKNADAAALLKDGYSVTESNGSVTLTTVTQATGDEIVDVGII